MRMVVIRFQLQRLFIIEFQVVVKVGNQIPADGEHQPADHERQKKEDDVPAPLDRKYCVEYVAKQSTPVFGHIVHAYVEFAGLLD